MAFYVKKNSLWIKQTVHANSYCLTRSSIIHSLLMFAFLVLSIFFVKLAIAQSTNILGVRIWHAPDHTRVVFDLSDKADYTISLLDQPSRYVVDFKSSALTGNIPANQNNCLLYTSPSPRDRG